MNTNREKTSSVMGLVISVLLHSIFFAGCIAIDFTIQQDGTATKTGKTEITKISPDPSVMAKNKS